MHGACGSGLRIVVTISMTPENSLDPCRKVSRLHRQCTRFSLDSPPGGRFLVLPAGSEVPTQSRRILLMNRSSAVCWMLGLVTFAPAGVVYAEFQTPIA